MSTISLFAIFAATVAGFVLGGLWYSPLLFGNIYASLRGLDPGATEQRLPVGEMIAEVIRVFIVATALAYFMAQLNISTYGEAFGLAVALWLGFQAMTIVGSVIHEGYPVPLFALHAGDALVKTIAMNLILVVWR